MVNRAKVLAMFFLLFTSLAWGADIIGLGPGVTGRWTVQISTPRGRFLGEAELVQTGNEVTGWLESSGGDRIRISGHLLAGKLIISTHPEPRHVVSFDRCELRVGDNHMKGIIYPGTRKVEFWKVREPRVPPAPRAWYGPGKN